jgi:plastocyanin
MRTIPALAASVAMAVAAIAVAACSGTGPAYGPPNPDAAATIEMSGFSFGPASVRVKAGDMVEWRNKSPFTHSVSADPARFPGNVSIPAGATPFDSGQLGAGQIFRHSFTTPGTYR